MRIFGHSIHQYYRRDHIPKQIYCQYSQPQMILAYNHHNTCQPSFKPPNEPHLWEVIMMALPLSRVHVTISQSRRRATGSIPVDGSSSRTTEVFPIRAIAVLSLRLVPPLYGHRKRENLGEREVIQISYLQETAQTYQQTCNMNSIMLISCTSISWQAQYRCIYQLIFI